MLFTFHFSLFQLLNIIEPSGYSISMDLISRISLATLVYLIRVNFALILPDRIGQKTSLMIKRHPSNRPDLVKTNCDSFRGFVSGSEILIDRSRFIEELLKHPEKRVIITCPPKWSKTINLNMIKTFVEIDLEFYYGRLPLNETFAYKLFKYGEASNGGQTENFKTPFIISKYPEVIDQYLGRHPVLNIRFRSIRGFNDLEIIRSVGSVLQQAYTPHTNLIDALTKVYTSENDTIKRTKAKSYLDHFVNILNQNETDEDTVTNGLNQLCKLLHRFYRKRVFVLIDDYDVPFNKLMHLDYTPQFEIQQVTNRLRQILNPILRPNNEYVERVVITGTHSIVDFLGTAAKSIPHYTPVNNPWIEYFGIGEHEQQQLFAYGNKSTRQCLNVALWYMGYKYGANESINLGLPYSTAKCLEGKLTKIYTPKNLYHDYLFMFTEITQIRKILELLMNGQAVTINFNDLLFKQDDIHLLKNIASDISSQIFKPSTVDLALSYLCASGVLTLAKPNRTAGTVAIRIPNIEAGTEICRKLKSYYQKTFGIDYNFVDKYVVNLGPYIVSDIETPTLRTHISLNHLFRHIKKFHPNIGYPNASEYYQDLMYAMLNFISFKLRSSMQFDTVVWKQDNPTIYYMLALRQSRGAIIATQYDQNIRDLMVLAKKQRHHLEARRNLTSRKFVVFALDKNKIASMDAEFDHMTDYGVFYEQHDTAFLDSQLINSNGGGGT